ncbi:armadillo-type protein [Lasiosphaeria hispida]|uniref:Armadillo-type protein n=1 Tax=Lasiosphaeria hispida TaxID=260671 RepID=A0AAJ0HM03_9PEZI|nr:armadillo-type protein [Lasiosphaeria hispida]
MATVEPSPQRTEFFKRLKAVCVPLIQLVLRPEDKSSDAKEILRLLEALLGLWTAQVSQDASILDEKLANYVFFPLSHLLRKQDQYPMRVIETVISLLGTLIQHGWKSRVSSELSQQLLLFFSFTLGGAPGQTQKRELPEDTVVESYRALTALVTTMGASSAILPPSSVAKDKTIPAMGHSVTIMLDAITAGVPPLVQLGALQCLQAVFEVTRDNAILAQFLPGTVSSLSKILSPPLQQKTQRRVLVRSLEVLNKVLVNVLADIKVRGLLRQREATREPQETPAIPTTDTRFRVELNPSWLKATAAQVKIALSSVLKLRSHESEDIQSALKRLCISLLDECHSSLAECRSILVESSMMLEDEDEARSHLQTSLQDLVGVYPELGDSIKSALYNWITGLPRVMQSNDERIKQLAIRSVLRGTRMAASLQMDSATLDDSLGDALRDSVVALVKNTKPSKVQDDAGLELTISGAGTSIAEMGAYSPVLLDLEGQRATRGEIATLISNIGSPTQQTKLATTMLAYVRDSEGVDQIASYWLAFELLKSTYAQSSGLDDLLDFSSLDESRSQEQVFQEIYDFSASVLSAHSDSASTDWRLEAIALEVTAFAATRLKSDFRPELIDVLYPIAAFLGSQNPQLRRHAITTLNIIAPSCGYDSVSELIVDNADYMVNSVSLRLNTFDISPASTKVLTMMIRLTGPKLIPFLDDVVAAIFAALDNYHGYPVFVENLFSVLSEVVTQGVRSDMLLLEGANSQAVDHKKRRPESRGVTGILDTLKRRTERAERETEETAKSVLGHPKEPWGPDKSQAKSLLNSLDSAGDEDGEDGEDESALVVEKPKQATTPTYSLLTRVLSLTQHYLTSPTPTLRKSLLDLVSTVSPALAPDENAFLPLVNNVWPVVISRLHDPEPFVAIAACKALAALCSAAGDFLASRFKTEWSSGLRKWFASARSEAAKARSSSGGGGGRVAATIITKTAMRMSTPSHVFAGGSSRIIIPGRSAAVDATDDGRFMVQSSPAAINSIPSLSAPSSSLSHSGGLGRFAQASQVWEAAVGLLGAIVTYVWVDDDMFDEILALVVDLVPRNGALREALEALNADAVWLALYERGSVESKASPVLEGFAFAPMEAGRSVVVVGS